MCKNNTSPKVEVKKHNKLIEFLINPIIIEKHSIKDFF
jgi:hypothetical protein